MIFIACFRMSSDTFTAPSISLEIVWRIQMAWGQISLILGILGNVFVLYATIPHNAIKLDRMSVWITQNLAVADICNCVFVLLPTLLAQYGKLYQTLIWEETFIKIMACYKYIFFSANLILVNILSLNKLLRCMFPLRNLNSTRRQKIIVTLATILISLAPTIWLVIGLTCGFMETYSAWKVIHYLGARDISYVDHGKKMDHVQKMLNLTIIVIFSPLPCLTLVILNTAIVVFALKKSNSAINKKNLLVVVLVTVGFLLSMLPHFADIALNFPIQEYNEMAWSVAFFSSWINPFIYFAANPTFKEFTVRKLLPSRARSVQPGTGSTSVTARVRLSSLD
jgi:hypothetical protein